MEIVFLGAHNVESRACRLTSLLIDDLIAIDAGSLTSTLTFEEQKQIKAIVLSHHHFDHVRDLMTFGLAWSYTLSIPVYGPQTALDILNTYLFNGKLYPDFTRFPPEKPVYHFHPLEPYHKENILGYIFLPLPVKHTSFTLGYEVTSPQGKRLFYSSDSGPGLSEIWEYIGPDLLVLETTCPDKYEEMMRRGGHLTPKLLYQELKQFKELKGYLPPVVLVHSNFQMKPEIEREVAEVAEKLSASINLAYDGLRLVL